jgi:hypothetical protein
MSDDGVCEGRRARWFFLLGQEEEEEVFAAAAAAAAAARRKTRAGPAFLGFFAFSHPI